MSSRGFQNLVTTLKLTTSHYVSSLYILFLQGRLCDHKKKNNTQFFFFLLHNFSIFLLIFTFFSHIRGVSTDLKSNKNAHTFDSQALKFHLECWSFIILYINLHSFTKPSISAFKSTQTFLFKIKLPVTLLLFPELSANLETKKKLSYILYVYHFKPT